MMFMVDWMKANKSLTMLLFSTILTGALAVPSSFIGFFVHLLNLGVLCLVRSFAKKTDPHIAAGPCVIGLLFSLGLTAFITATNEFKLVFEGINAVLLLCMIYIAHTIEHD